MIELKIYESHNREEFINNIIINNKLANILYRVYNFACKAYGEQNVALWDSDNNYCVMVKFGNINFTNKNRSHYLMQNVYAGFMIAAGSNIYIKPIFMRTKFTPSEFYSSYCWSHVPTNYLASIKNKVEMFVPPSKVCTGRGLFPENIELLSVLINRDTLTDEDNEIIDLRIDELWYQLRYLYLTYESIEGTPYMKRHYITNPPRDNDAGSEYFQSDNPITSTSNLFICSRRMIKDNFEALTILLKPLLYIGNSGFGIYMEEAIEQVNEFFVSLYRNNIRIPGVSLYNLIENKLYYLNTVQSSTEDTYDTSIMNMLTQVSNKYIYFRGEKVQFEIDLTDTPKKIAAAPSFENLTLGKVQAESIILKYLNILNENYAKYTASKRDPVWFTDYPDFTASLRREESTFDYSERSTQQDQILVEENNS